MSIQEDWRDKQPPKKGMSGTMKVLLILGGIGGLCALLCCGGFAFLGWKAKNVLENAITTDPEAIRTRTKDIAEIDVLPEFKPFQAMDLIVMKWVLYNKGGTAQDEMLMLMEFNTDMAGANGQQTKDQMLESMKQQGNGPGNTNVKAESTETHTYEVGGKQVKFDFVKGKSDAGKDVRQVVGMIPTKKGVAMVMLIVAEENYDEDAVKAMIASIKVPGAGPLTPTGSMTEDGATEEMPEKEGEKGEGEEKPEGEN